MNWAGRLRAVVSAVVMIATAVPSFACGFEDPSSATLQRGLLNWVYPKSLYVSTAVWQAQMAGIVAKDRPLTGNLAGLGLLKTQLQMRQLEFQIVAAAGARQVPRFSVVLLGPMLWTSYDEASGMVRASVHAKGPTPGDVVVVTDGVVVTALLTGSLTVREASDLGLIRFYGDDADIAQLQHVLDDLKPVSRRTASATRDSGANIRKVARAIAGPESSNRLPLQSE